MADLSDALIAEAVEYLDELLDEHAVRFAPGGEAARTVSASRAARTHRGAILLSC
jgi:threonine aldolase